MPTIPESEFQKISQPIESPYRARVEQGLPAFDAASGDFPWKQDWFPAKD